MRRTRSNFAAAFTLIELVLVLLLIAAITAMAVPSISSFSQNRKMDDSAGQMVSLARWARTQAIARGVSFRLNIDSSKNMYWLTMQNGASFENNLQDDSSSMPNGSQGSTNNTTQFGAVGEEMGRQFGAPDGVTLACTAPPQPGGQYVEFRSTGRCDPATVKLTDRRGKVIEVGVLASTENWRVLTAEERQQETTLPPPTPALVR